jgi:hypothetical protein
MINKLYKPFANGVIIISDWWYTYPSEKYEFVSWDDSSQLNGQKKIQTTTMEPQIPERKNATKSLNHPDNTKGWS